MTNHTSSNADLDYGVHYRVWHDDSDAHAAEMTQWYVSEIGRFLPDDRSSRCLDIGCGMGFTLLALEHLGFRDVSGIDIDRSQVDAAVRRGLAVERVTDTPGYLRERPSQFAVILMLDVLEHIAVADQLDSLRAIHAALRPGGRLIVQVPNASSPLAARWRYIDYTHTSSFTEHSLRFVLANAGFRDVQIPVARDPRFPRFPRRFWRLARWQQFGREFRAWICRSLWRQMCIAELGTGRGADAVSLSLNLIAIGFKPNEPTA